MGERSVPVTRADGNSSAKSIAQVPVPVPTSRTGEEGRRLAWGGVYVRKGKGAVMGEKVVGLGRMDDQGVKVPL